MIYIINILQVIEIPRVLYNTATNMVRYEPIPKMGMVCAGTGTVLKFLTHGIPVTNPNESKCEI